MKTSDAVEGSETGPPDFCMPYAAEPVPSDQPMTVTIRNSTTDRLWLVGNLWPEFVGSDCTVVPFVMSEGSTRIGHQRNTDLPTCADQMVQGCDPPEPDACDQLLVTSLAPGAELHVAWDRVAWTRVYVPNDCEAESCGLCESVHEPTTLEAVAMATTTCPGGACECNADICTEPVPSEALPVPAGFVTVELDLEGDEAVLSFE